MRPAVTVSDEERILAARLIARKLLLGQLEAGAPENWSTSVDEKGGIVSKSPHAPAERPRE